MWHRLPSPSDRSLRPYFALAILSLFLTHCQKNDETPPPSNVQAPAAASSIGQGASACCELAPATGLEDGMGRVTVAFPSSAEPKQTRVAVLSDGKEVQAGHGNQAWVLPPGTYEVTISDQSLRGVTVQAGHETKVKVGVLHVNAAQNTHVELMDPTTGKVIAGGYGERSYGLPIGLVSVQVAGQTETVAIEEGAS